MKKSTKKLLALALALALLLGLAPGALADITAGTHDLVNVSIVPGSETLPNEAEDPYEVTLAADSGYFLPASVGVTIGGTAAGPGDIAWGPVTGELSVLTTQAQWDADAQVVVTAYGVEGIDVSFQSDPPPNTFTPDLPFGYIAPPDGIVTLPSLSTTEPYIFLGWEAQVELEGVFTIPGGPFTGSFDLPGHDIFPGDEIHFVAQWEQMESRNLWYEPGTTDPVTGMPDPDMVEIYNGIPFTAAAAPSRSGYAFAGWLPNWGQIPDAYPAGASIVITEGDYPQGEVLTLTAQWVPAASYVIYASSSVGGNIFPPGWSFFSGGETQIYTFTPALGYSVKALYVDDAPVSVPGSGTYTFWNIQANHKIYVEFGPSVKIPQTGDQTPLGAAPIALMALCLAAAAGMLAYRSRKKQ